MRKYYKVLLISVLGITHYNAQVHYDLQINNIKARVNSNIHLFNDNDNGIGMFESTLHNNASTIYNSALWLAAELPNGDLAVAAEKFCIPSVKDFQSGPIGDVYNVANKRVYPVKKTEIDMFIAWSNCLHDPSCNISTSFPNYTIPQSILDWPAHGDLSNNEAFSLAPFFDVDSDGVYNPIAGDYPLIKGDEAVFYILNDDIGTHTSSGGQVLGVELHIMVYAFDSPIFAVSNTIFVNYKIHNRSAIDYTNFKIGTYTDLDIGCSSNDFVGCDTNRNMFYAYNQYDNDVSHPGSNPCSFPFDGSPAQGVQFLNKELTSFGYYAGAGPPNMLDPLSGMPAHFYNNLSSLWRDGSPFYVGGSGYSGYPGVSNTVTNYTFPSFPSLTSGWSQMNSGFTELDMRALGVVEESNFNSGDVVCFDMAYTFNYDHSVDNIGNVSQLLAASDQVQSFYDNNQLGCDNLLTSINEQPIKTIETTVYPNPFSDKTIMTFNKEVDEGELKLYNSLGQNVRSYSLKGKNKIEIQKENLDNGVYFYSVIESNGAVGNGKIIVK